MSLTNIKSRLFRYRDMGFYALVQLKQWMTHSSSFNSFDPESFEAPSLRIAQATDGQGETICFAPVENVLIVSAYAVNPQATKIAAQRAGNLIDEQIACEAQRLGISKILIMVPDESDLPEDEIKTIRFYERTVPIAVNTFALGCSTQSQPTHYIH